MPGLGDGLRGEERGERGDGKDEGDEGEQNADGACAGGTVVG